MTNIAVRGMISPLYNICDLLLPLYLDSNGLAIVDDVFRPCMIISHVSEAGKRMLGDYICEQISLG